MLTADQRRFLLTLARDAVTTAVLDGRLHMVTGVEDDLTRDAGAFVTLTRFGHLRGCIGHIEAVMPLYRTVIEMAAAAALQDPRFPPVAPGELDDLHLEISILSPLVPATADEVVVGTHGLVVEQGRARGLLLPQVPVEWGWCREEFLAHTCRKAGLAEDAWRRGASLFTFTAEVFSENDVG